MVEVPADQTIKEYVHQTGDFTTDVVAVLKEKQGQYTAWFRTVEGIRRVKFSLIQTLKHTASTT